MGSTTSTVVGISGVVLVVAVGPPAQGPRLPFVELPVVSGR
jgi:hypothetical protein